MPVAGRIDMIGKGISEAAGLVLMAPDGNELTVVFSGYGGDAVWVFDLAAVRAEAAACQST